MDNNPIQTTSFIPKKPLVGRRDFGTNVSGIFIFISIIIFIFSVAGYFIIVRQEKVKIAEVASLRANIKKAEEQFEPNQVINMTRFDTKLKVAEDLLYLNKESGSVDTMAHITLQPLFKLLSEKTLVSIRFKDFKYTNVENQKIEIKMSGEAKSVGNTANYAAVAQQAREFTDSRQLTNVIVSDLNLGANNNVTFNLSAGIKPELISYTEFLKE